MYNPFFYGVLALLIPALPTTPAAEQSTTAVANQSPTPAAVIERHIAAAGGRAILEKIQTQLSLLDVREGGDVFAATVRFKQPGKLLLTVTVPNGFEVRQGQETQDRGWRQDPNGVRELKSATDLLDFRELSLSLNATALLRLEKLAPQLTLVEGERIGARPCQVLEARMEQGTLKLWFDGQTGLLTKVGQTDLGEYGLENGVRVPHLIHKEDNSLLKVKSVSFNSPMDDKQFAQPAGALASGNAAPDPMTYVTVLNRGTQLGLVRHPAASSFGRPRRSSLPVYRAESQNPFQVDLRGTDVSGLSLTGRLSDLLHADFDSQTVWPAKLPEGFKTEVIMEQGKNPGLGLRALHQKGITGQGIGLAVIDQTLLVDHLEYKDQLRSYEEIHAPNGAPAQMHGPAVASIAVGKTVGVAPGADLYYIAETHGLFQRGKFDWDFNWLAQSIDRILELNAALPMDRKIRVISISVGWSEGQKGCAETDAAVRRAKDAGIFVISTAIERTHQLAFHGLGREPGNDPDQPTSYGPGSWWAASFFDGQRRFGPGHRLLVPMDARTTASPTGEREYVFYAAGGWSWSVPYLAGLYALACQVHPNITPEEFWATALKTGRVVPVQHDGSKLELGNIVDPAALIEALRKSSS